MSKIKIQFALFEKGFAAQILEMDERFRSSSSKHRNSYTTKQNTVCVMSTDMPCLQGSEVIKLWGHDKLYGDAISSVEFNDNTERDARVLRLIRALEDWAENWEGFKTPTNTPRSKTYIDGTCEVIEYFPIETVPTIGRDIDLWKNNVRFGWYVFNDGSDIKRFLSCNEDITHWSHIPKGPKAQQLKKEPFQIPFDSLSFIFEV